MSAERTRRVRAELQARAALREQRGEARLPRRSQVAAQLALLEASAERERLEAETGRFIRVTDSEVYPGWLHVVADNGDFVVDPGTGACRVACQVCAHRADLPCPCELEESR